MADKEESISIDSTSKTKAPKAGDPNVINIPMPAGTDPVGIPLTETHTGKPGEKYKVEIKKANGKIRTVQSH